MVIVISIPPDPRLAPPTISFLRPIADGPRNKPRELTKLCELSDRQVRWLLYAIERVVRRKSPFTA